MKTLLKIIAVLVIALIAYNYFFGTDEEKAGSEKIINEVKDLGTSVGNLLQEEHKKFREGKYDDVLDKLKASYEELKEVWSKTRPEMMEKLNDLQEKRDKLEKEAKQAGDSTDVERLKLELKQLVEETSKLLDEQ